MADFNIAIPKLGESIQEGTITKLFVKEGDNVKEDDILFELATDKVDSEIPSPVAGRIKEIKCAENETYPVGEVVIVISTGESEDTEEKESVDQSHTNNSIDRNISQKKSTAENESSQLLIEKEVPSAEVPGKEEIEKEETSVLSSAPAPKNQIKSPAENLNQERFISPLVKNIAEKEGIPLEELSSIAGSGLGGRVQRNDILKYLEERQAHPQQPVPEKEIPIESELAKPVETGKKFKVSVSVGAEDTVVKMDRVRKLIADHMVMSKDVAAHVTSVVEADVTNLVLWRNNIKDRFFEKYNEKITFLPMITEIVAKALSEFKIVNASVDGDNIVLRKHINIGIAVAKEDDTLIVPVIKDADTKNVLGLTREINGFGLSAKNNKILPDQLQGGSFSITNFGSFKNIIGTPIINQPQVAILAVGLIEKKPAVMETPTGDVIVVRHKMFLSLSYDHRVIDGMLGGKFLRRIADLLEQFDVKREI
jgi:2-oxoglutarate dehydrogenase E2 component (dihydrolipoamide succinyltransferase)